MPRALVAVFLSPAAGRTWGADVLGQRALPPGEGRAWTVQVSTTTGPWDLLAVDIAGGWYRLDGQMLTGGRRTSLNVEVNQRSARPAALLGRLVLTNASAHTVQSLFCSPTEDPTWGVDLLGEGRLMAPGDSVAFAVLLARHRQTWEVLGLSPDRTRLHRLIDLSAALGDYYFELGPEDVSS